MKLVQTVRTWGRMVKFSHSLFALPFALSGAALAAQVHGITAWQIFWIVVAMFAVRNAAMGFNRLADHEYDARNPRTQTRELPQGRLSRGAVWVFTLALSGLFVLAAFQLRPICGWLSPLALLIVSGYSYTKRFTWWTHIFLGLALAMAPVGGWLAVAGELALAPWLLGLAMLTWVAGFDVIYACQDMEFDRHEGLRSIPACFGIHRSLIAARILHVVTLLGLAAVGWVAELHPVYWAGLAVIGGLLLWEHRLLWGGDLSKVGVAFFNMNGVISVVYLGVILVAVLL